MAKEQYINYRWPNCVVCEFCGVMKNAIGIKPSKVLIFIASFTHTPLESLDCKQKRRDAKLAHKSTTVKFDR